MTPVDTNLAGFHDLELQKKLNHLLIELWLQDAFQGAWGSLYFQGAWKNHPCTFGEQTIAGKDVSPVITVVGTKVVMLLSRPVMRKMGYAVLPLHARARMDDNLFWASEYSTETVCGLRRFPTVKGKSSSNLQESKKKASRPSKRCITYYNLHIFTW